ncbi:uncharacterized protein trim33l isoform X7 [Sebastes fasciatus]|uniref:uncharacterized protein trim33l isoform X7 n=1 Tax=Sebastes fasciatus TaxID=394691 RepID=UPI003D9DCEC1
MTSLFNMEAAANVSQQCCSCDASSARCWCVDCNEALCDICVSAHRRVTVTRSHRILNQPPAGGVSTPPTKFCRLHPSEPLKLYCFTCNQLTCRDCQLTAHMNHRYQFVREALHTLKKQLEVRVQPIRAQGDRVSRILLDMETRLQDIANSQSCLKTELQQSYTVLIQHLKMRMVEILKQVEKVCESEYEWIQRRMRRMKQLMQKQQAVTEIAEKARNTSDLSALWTYTTQVESQLKNLPDEDLSPPQTMSELKVVTDHSSLDAVVNFGALQVLWVPFAVSQTSNQNTPAGFSSYPSTPACPDPTYRPLPQTRTTRDSPVPVGSSSTSSSQLCPLSFTVTPTTSTCPAPSRRTDSPAPVTCPSTSWKSSLSFNQSNAPFATTAAVTSAVQHPSSTLSQLEKNSPGQVPQPFSAPLPPSAGPSSVLQPVQPSLVLNQPTAPHKNQSTAALLNITQTVYQVSCLPPAVPQFPMLLSQASPGNTWPKQKYLMGNVIPGRLSPASVSSKIPPAATTGNQISVGPSQTALHPPPTSSPPSSTQRLDPDTDPGPHSSSLDQQQQSPVVRAVADSACDCSVQQAAARQPEPAENEPTSTVSEEPAGKPSAPEEPEPEPEVLDKEVEEPEPEVSDSEGGEPEPEPQVSDKEVEEPEPEVSDRDVEKPEPEVLDSEGDKLEPEPLVSDSGGDEPELLVSDSEGDELEPELLVSDSEGDELEPELLVSDSEGDELEPELLVSDSEGDELEPESLVSDSGGDEPELLVSDSEGDELEPELLVSDSEGDELEPESLVSDSEGDELEPESLVSDSEGDEPEPKPEVSDSESDEPGLVIGESVSSLSQWQPSVVLLRLPVSSPRPGCPLPCFSLVAGDDEDEFYLKEIQDTQSHAGDVTDDTITELPSPPSSPATLVIVTCSACRSANSSIICSFCGRGYHRDCHLPPVGPDLRSEWMCSLCQDLSDPSDPFSSDRPPRPHSPCLSLQDQRRCESLLLYVKVEGCPRLPQCQLTVMSERLTLCRSPSYRTAAEFLSDIWSLFKDASEDDDVLMRLQESLRCRWIGGLGPELRNTDGGKHAVKQPFTSDMSDAEQAAEHFKGSKVKMEEEEVAVTSESKMKETRKRLRALLHLVELARSKRAKTDKMAERQNP